MIAIQVDFDVFKELTVRRVSESVTENDVIRQLLKLPEASNDVILEPSPWVCKGVPFPDATLFRATYKGLHRDGKVISGALVVNGERFTSPSAAAVSITENNVNGWRFWECLLPGSKDWVLMEKVRKNFTG